MQLRRLGVAAATILALGLPIVVPVQQAQGFDEHGPYCPNKPDRKGRFTSDAEWSLNNTPPPGYSSANLKWLFEVGFDKWKDQTRDRFGNVIFDESGSDFWLDWEQGGQMNGAFGVTICTSSNPLWLFYGTGIQLNRNRLSDLRNWKNARIVGFSAHEWSHAFGLAHTGKFDSWSLDTGGWPIGATCDNAVVEYRNTVTNDDAAAAEYISDDGSWESVTANSSFEQGDQWWWSDGPLTTVWGGVDSTPRAIKIAGGKLARSTTRVTDQQGHVNSDGNVTGDRMFARANFKDAISGASGRIYVRVYQRPVIYTDGTDWGCNFYGDIKNSLVSVPGLYWISTTVACTPTSVWKYCDTHPQSSGWLVVGVNGYGTYDNPDAVDVQVRVINSTVYGPGSQPAPVIVDRARVEFDF